MKTILKTDTEWIFETNRGNRYHMTCHFPEENPEGALEHIVDAMAYVGLFDGITKDQPD